MNEKLQGDPGFTASVGWLSWWKARHGIREVSVSGENLSGDNSASDDFKTKFEKFVKDELPIIRSGIFKSQEALLQKKPEAFSSV